MTSTTAQQQSSTETNTEAQAKTNEKATESSEAATPAAGEEKTGDHSENSETNSSPAKKPAVRKSDFEQGKVYLYQFERCSSVPSVVAQCLRLETFLRVAEIPHENVDHMMRYKSANGDLPFIEINGREIADTEVIIEELSKEFKDLDADLTEAQKVISYSLQSMILNHTSWVVRCWRYKHPQEFLKTSRVDVKKTINSRVPSPLLNFMFKIGFKSNIKDLIGHGIGNRNPEQVYNAGKKDLQNLSRQLGENDYFFGGKPHLLDCLAFAVLCQFIYVPFEGFDEYIKNDTPNLLRFVEKVKSEYWKDWDEVCKLGELNTHSPKKEGDSDEAKKDEDAAAEKKKQEDLKKEKEEKKRKEKEERERKKKEEKEEKERKKREAKEKAEKEKAQKEKAAKEKSEKSGEEGGDAEATKKDETTEKGDKTEADKSETKESDAKGGDA